MTRKRSKTKHKQAPIMHKGEVVFSVDQKLQTLIQFFVDNEIATFNSCEDNVAGTCWIQFGLGDWIYMSDKAFRTKPQDLYRFVKEMCHIKLLSIDDGFLDDDDNWIEGENLIWSASVRFPKERLRKFERLVRSTLGNVARPRGRSDRSRTR